MHLYINLSIDQSVYLPIKQYIYLYVYPFIDLTIYVFVNLYIELYIYVSVNLYIYLTIYLCVCQFIHLSNYISMCLSIYLSAHPSIHLSICPSIYLIYIYLSPHLSISLDFHFTRNSCNDIPAVWHAPPPPPPLTCRISPTPKSVKSRGMWGRYLPEILSLRRNLSPFFTLYLNVKTLFCSFLIPILNVPLHSSSPSLFSFPLFLLTRLYSYFFPPFFFFFQSSASCFFVFFSSL